MIEHTSFAALAGIAHYLPEGALTNVQLEREWMDWSAAKIESKTGINQRHIAGPQQTSSDLGVAAAQKLFEKSQISPEKIDYLLFCTQSPDYFLPTTACIVQERLGLTQQCGALDFNLGCSGYVYGLGLAKSLIETDQADNVLLITAETYSKFIHPNDRSVRTIFGDASAATLISRSPGKTPLLGPFVYGTDGRGANNLIVKRGGMRHPEIDASLSTPSESNLYMNGAEIFAFTLRVVPDSVNQLLYKANLKPDDIDLYVFHQANHYMLEHLRKKLDIPAEKLVIAMRECGNTVSSTIPIALEFAIDKDLLRSGMTVMLVGFGVGYSWGAMILRWAGLAPRF